MNVYTKSDLLSSNNTYSAQASYFQLRTFFIKMHAQVLVKKQKFIYIHVIGTCNSGNLQSGDLNSLSIKKPVLTQC